MRTYGALNPIDQVPFPPDTVQTLLIANSSGQALGWFVSSGVAPNAGDAGVQLVRFTMMSTALVAGAPALTQNFFVNLVSTHASVPTSGSSVTTGTTANSTGNSIPVLGSRLFQVPSYSTGWSVASPSSGLVMAEVWRK